MHEIVMQRLDPEMKEGTILEWLKKEGDNVLEGEPIAKIEGEKVIFEIKAPAAGVLAKRVPEGKSVHVGQQIAVLVEPGDVVPALTEAQAEKSLAKVEPLKASPAARRVAYEHNIDLAEIRGSGPGGEILKKDILALVEKRIKGGETVDRSGWSEVMPLVGMRKTIAERLTASYRTAPHVAITMEVDMSESLRLQETVKKMKNIRIPITALLTKVVAHALRSHPLLNSTLEGDQVKILKNINMGIAIALDEGLIVPVIYDADKKRLSEIASVITDLIRKARHRSLSIEELKGGTFTITNLGAFDVDVFTPIINPPQTAILGVGRIAERPASVGGQVRILPTMTLTLVFDHRVVDGAQAAQFLQEIKKLLENPPRSIDR